MSYRSYEWKIIYALIIVFFVIQAGIFIGLSYQNQRIARESLELELQTGAEVLNRLLRLRHRQLEQSARVLAADPGLRDALRREDLNAALALLQDHRGRIEQATVMLSGHDGELLLLVPDSFETIRAADVRIDPSVFARFQDAPQTALVNATTPLVYQVLTVPVLTGPQQDWLTIAMPLADSVVQTLESVANTQYSFLSRQDDGSWLEHASTFSPPDSRRLAAGFQPVPGQVQELEAETGSFLLTPFRLSEIPGQELTAMVGKSLDQAMQPFDLLQRNLMLWVALGGLLTAVAIFLVTRRLVRPLNAMAYSDQLTGLANRRCFDAAISKMEATGQASLSAGEGGYAVMLMDLQGFEAIKTRFGHAAGDDVIRTVGDRLRDTLRKSDIIARYGGDEFAVLMQNVNEEACVKVAEMIMESLESRIAVGCESVGIGVSIGIALSPGDGLDRETLMARAAGAMQSARASGGGFVFASSEHP